MWRQLSLQARQKAVFIFNYRRCIGRAEGLRIRLAAKIKHKLPAAGNFTPSQRRYKIAHHLARKLRSFGFLAAKSRK